MTPTHRILNLLELQRPRSPSCAERKGGESPHFERVLWDLYTEGYCESSLPTPKLFICFRPVASCLPFLFSFLPLAILPSSTKVTVFLYHKRWKASREEDRCPSFPNYVLLPYLQTDHEHFSLIILWSLTTQRPSLAHLQAIGHSCQISLIPPT